MQVASIESFLKVAGRELAMVPKNADGREPVPPLGTLEDFLRIFRLNPKIRVPCVRVLRLNEVAGDAPHDASRAGPPAPSYRGVTEGEPLSVLEVLATHSDEPDWGMDQDLFSIEGYGLGRPPFGAAQGKSSQASFHMAFFHESPLLRWVAPQVRESFLPRRLALCRELSRVAARVGMDYWAWRFSAWALHYLQDLTQPYHASALPFSRVRMIRGLLGGGSRGSFAERHKTYLMNRHYLFEATVHLLLNDAVKSRGAHPFVVSLKRSSLGPCPRLDDLAAWSRPSVRLARQVNRTFERLLADSRIDTVDYLAAENGAYPIGERLDAAKHQRPDVLRAFLDVTGRCLAIAGEATRCLLEEW